MEKGTQPPPSDPTAAPSDQPPAYTPSEQGQGQPQPQPQYEPPPAQAGYGQPAPGQPGYGQPGYGQPMYGQQYPPGYQASPGVAGSNIVVLQSGAPYFGESPVPMKCTNCQSDITTTTSYQVGTLAWVICAVLFLVGLGFAGLLWFCSFIPFCVPSCKDVIHKCPNCGIELGRLRRM